MSSGPAAADPAPPAPPWRRPAVLLALGIALSVSVAGVFQRDLWTPDEPRIAEIARGMALEGWSATPRLAGEPFVEEPPLFYWSVALSYRLFGVSPEAARVPVAAYGVLLLGVAFLLGRRVGGDLGGLCTVAVLAATAKFASNAHRVLTDVPLALFVAAGHLAFLAARDRWREGRGASRALAGLGLCAGLAFLSKGPIGPILLAGPAILAAAATDRGILARAALGTGAACAAGVALLGGAWVLALAGESGWGAVEESLLHNSLGRFLGDPPEGAWGYGHDSPWWFYAFAAPAGFLPWTAALPAAWRGGALSREREGGRARFLGLVALSGVLLLSLPSSKRGVYLLPLLPAACAVPGAWLADLARRAPGALDRWTLLVLLLVPAAACLALGGALAAFAAGADLPGPLAGLAVQPPARFAAAAAGCLAAAGALGLCARGALRGAGTAGVVPAVLAMAGTVVVLQGLVEPLQDPMESLREGSIRAAACFPEGRTIHALAVTETTRAAIPFYSGRRVDLVKRREDVPGHLGDAGGTLFLVDDREWADGAVRRAGAPAERVATIRLNARHAVRVMRWLP